MSQPNLPSPVVTQPVIPTSKTGEGAETALAAMIRKRKMGENPVDRDALDTLPRQAAPDA